MRWLNTLAGHMTSWLDRRGTAPPSEEERQREEAMKEQFRNRCINFRRLIAANKAALEAMTALETQFAAGETPHSKALHNALHAIARPLQEMVYNFDALSGNAYPSLSKRLELLLSQTEGVVQSFNAVPEAPLPVQAGSADAPVPFFVTLHDPLATQTGLCGPKMARLAHNAQSPIEGVAVPQGFVGTRAAFDAFMASGDVGTVIARELERLHADGDDALNTVQSVSDTIAQAIVDAPIPPDVAQYLDQALAVLREAYPQATLAVRSSALGEDSLASSFAGQYVSLLRVPYAEASMAWKRVIASLYGVNALTYQDGRALRGGQEVMCVGFLVMLDVVVGGVAYSVDPLKPEGSEVVVQAAQGSVAAVVDGSVAPDIFRVDVGAGRVDAPAVGHSGMTREQAFAVARLARSLHESEGGPQDVEWAFEADDMLHLLQTRPLDCHAQEDEGEVVDAGMDAAVAALPLLYAGGQTASPGVGSGPAHCVLTERDMAAFPVGGVLVVAHALPRWAPLLRTAAALVSETGGSASHLASVAREYGVPALFGAQGVVAAVKAQSAQPLALTVVAHKQAVHVGLTEAALFTPEGRANARRCVPHALRPLADRIFPLHLTDPDSKGFTPEGCETLHDVIRFCHEKSVEALFGARDGEDALPLGKQLSMGRTRLRYWLLDMGGGFAGDVLTPFVDIAQIRSLPMLALWNGMVSIPWAGPPATDGRGFFSIVAHSAANPELDPLMRNSMAENNYFLISDTFCNLQTRIGYHFCTVEAEVGNPEHANYASFHFKGGAASRDRRALRVRFMADILQAHGFHTSAQSDVLFAYREGGSEEDILEKTRILGYLLLHTRQIDMIMHNASMVASLKQKFEKEIQTLLERPFDTHALR